MKKKEKGQSMVEFALVFPIMLLVVTGITFLFYLFGVLVTTHNAVSEGGRAALVWRPDGDGVSTCIGDVTDAIERITPFFDPARDVIAVSANCSADPWARIPSGNNVYVGLVIYWEPTFYSTLFKDEWDPPMIIPLPASVEVVHQ